MLHRRLAIVSALILATAMPAAAAAPVSSPGASAVARSVAARKVPAHQIRVVLKGDRLGKRARVTLRAVAGPAKGISRTVKVRKAKTVRRLPAGRYRVSGKPIMAKGRTATATSVRVRVTERRGATARLVYRVAGPDVTAPGTVQGLRVTSRSVTSIGLAWTNPGDGDLAEVIVRRAPGTVAPATVAEGVGVALSSPTADALADSGLPAVSTYSYSVFTRDASGNTGAGVPVATSTYGAIAAGDNHTCAIAAGGTVKCWGSNDDGQLGDDTKTDRKQPVSVKGLGNVVALAAGELHTCALLGDGRIACWGGNWSGQIGDGTNTMRLVPVVVPGISTATGIGAGGEHSCAVLRGGTIQCWGFNGSGQIGDGTTGWRYAPVPVAGIDNAVAVSTGSSHTCALLTTGTVRCWGSNVSGQIGDGTKGTARLTPAAVIGITNATAVTAGGSHTCALLSGGTGVCWGSNAFGQVGDGTHSTDDRPTRVSVAGLAAALAIDAGWQHTCAVLTDGTAQCWGVNGLGQLGDGTDSTRYLPTPVTGLERAVGIAAGNGHTCAITTENQAFCWGGNDQGQLGDGTQDSRSIPAPTHGL